MDNTIINYYILFWIFIVGLCLGSFYNVVILRSLNGESIIYPSSKCPKCGEKLKPWHNIPVISYIILKGKCAFCKEKISIQYPIVELVTGILFALTYIKFGLSHLTLMSLFCISCLIIMTVTDLKEKIVDCNYAIAIAIAGFIYAFAIAGFDCLKDSLLGALLGFITIEILARCGHLLKKGRAFGEADSYVAGALGAIVGYQDIFQVLLYSLIASMVVILPAFYYDRYKNNDILMFLFSSAFFIVLSWAEILENDLWTVILLGIIGLVLIYLILKNVHEGAKLNYLPFVPALGAGFLYYIMFVL